MCEREREREREGEGGRVCFTTTAIFIPYHHGRNEAHGAETKIHTIHSLDQHAPYVNSSTRRHTHTHKHTNQPLQPFAPSLVYPAEQSSHLKDPTVLVHVRLLWQPPLLVLHRSTSGTTCAGLCECYPPHTHPLPRTQIY